MMHLKAVILTFLCICFSALATDTNTQTAKTMDLNEIKAESIKAPEATHTPESSSSLDLLINKIDDMVVNTKPKNQDPLEQTQTQTNDTTTTEPNNILSTDSASDENKETIETKQLTANDVITEETKSVNAESLAQSLFLMHNSEKAAIFYKKAMAIISQKTPNYHADRAWFLFQLANCYRHTNMQTSLEKYQQLITEYPNTPWAEYARAQIEIIKFMMDKNPKAYLESINAE